MPQVYVPDLPRTERRRHAADRAVPIMVDLQHDSMREERCRDDLAPLAPGVRRVLGPRRGHVSLSPTLAEPRAATVRGAREETD